MKCKGNDRVIKYISIIRFITTNGRTRNNALFWEKIFCLVLA